MRTFFFFFFGLCATVRGPRAEPVTFYADWFPGAQFAGVYVAMDKGFYRDAGLEVTVVPFEFGMKHPTLIDAEPERCALGAMEGYILLQHRGRGTDLVALAAQFQESPAGFMSLASAGISSAKDFVGRRIGVHAYADPLYRWFLDHAGVPEKDATMIFVKDDVAPLVRGEIDAMQGYATEEFLTFKAIVGEKARFVSFRDLGFDAYSEVLFTTRAQSIRHADALAKFVAATQRGWRGAFNDVKAATASVVIRAASDADPRAIAASLNALRPYVMPKGREPFAPMEPAKWRRMQGICREMGFMATVEPVEGWLMTHP